MRKFYYDKTSIREHILQNRHQFANLTLRHCTFHTEQGRDLLVQLGLLTDMQFSCTTGMTGSFARGLLVNIERFSIECRKYLRDCFGFA